jgi:hypothetical protein
MAQENVPLKHWLAPLYWQPNQAEREAAAKAAPQLQFSSSAVSTSPLTFVAITPCRLVDTRGTATGFNGIEPFSGPSLVSAGTATFPVQSSAEASANTMPSPCGVIPSIAQAYSFNLTVVPQAGGAVGYVSLWPAGSPRPADSTLNDVQGTIVANAAIVPAGTPSGGVSVYNSGPATIDVVIDMNGYFAAPSDLNGNTAIGVGTLANNTTGANNAASGTNALQGNTTGSQNTADGSYTLTMNSTGSNNTALGSSALFANTTGINNTASGSGALFNNSTGSNNTATGYLAMQFNTAGAQNTANGAYAMQNSTGGGNNTASGYYALWSNTDGGENTASGAYAMEFNTTGTGNTAIGDSALQINTSGNYNTASGLNALINNTTGNSNTAVGLGALAANETGNENTAVGQMALPHNTTGSGNIAIGLQAGINAPVGNSNSIYVNSGGYPNDISGTVRIGIPVIQTSFFVGGVSGVTTGASGAVPVVIDSNGQLGTMSSSMRFKEDIQDMGETSSGLLRLRPVTFRYKRAYADGSKPVDYGLIAEEVADVYPDLVVRDKDGRIQTVQYQKLTPMLLNEVQKQSAQIRSLEERLAALEDLLGNRQ